MSDFASFCLYMTVFISSAYLFHFGMKQRKEGKRYGLFLIFAILIPTILAAVRDKVGTDYGTYKYIYKGIAKAPGFSWFESKEGTDANLVLVFLIGKFASLFNSHQVFFGTFAFLILFFMFLGIKDRDLDVSNFVIAFIFLSTTFTNSFNMVKQTLALAIVFWGVKFAEKRKPIEFLLTVILASMAHQTAFVAIPIYFMCGEEKPWSNLKRLFIIIGAFVAIIAFPSILSMMGARFESYANDYDGEIGNLSFYLNLAWTIIFVVAYGKMVKINKSNSLFIFMLVISSIFQLTGFISPALKRIASYYTIPRFILMAQLPCLFAKEDKLLINSLVFLYAVVMFILSYWIMDFSAIFPYNYKF